MSTQAPRIVTDSTADIPPAIARRLDITVIPCQIQFGQQAFRDGVDITRAEFYRRLRGPERCFTSQPPVGVFAEAYRRLLAESEEIVSIHLASRLSGVFNAARLAATEVSPERITMIDSQQVSMCIGWLAILAAEAAQKGCSRDEIVRLVQERVPRLRLFALIDDLRYLHRGGRVGWASSLIGSLFDVKPMLLVKDGQANLAEKSRSWARAMDRLASSLNELGPVEHIAVLHADAPRGASELVERISAFLPGQEILIAEAGIIVSAHAGPGAVGAAVVLAG